MSSGVEEYVNRAEIGTGTFALGPSEAYVKDWQPKHAFREFYQNWKDGMTQSFALGINDLRISTSWNREGAFVAEARHKDTDRLFGYITFASGLLEFTNFNACLGRNWLDLGQSSKRDDYTTAGCHGEGGKLGSLVMLRHNYQVRYEASGHRWIMKLGGKKKGKCQDMLHCTITAPPERIETHESAFASLEDGTRRELLRSYISEDVCVQVGAIAKKGLQIETADFVQWMDISIDLHRPTTIVDTPFGILILDEDFRGRLYLKGLLLKATTSEKTFKFGYNFNQGAVNRDRERLASSRKEALTIAKIWSWAMDQQKDIVKDYVVMLREDKAADVNLAEHYISKLTAKIIWDHLLQLDPKGKLFYHDEKSGDKDVDIIRHSLKKKPEQLPRCIWTCLRNYAHARTPKEHQCYLLQSTPDSPLPDTPYVLEFKRALLAILLLSKSTQGLEVTFKSGHITDLDLLVTGSKLEIYDKWFQFSASHQKSLCFLSRTVQKRNIDVDHFTCVHLITELYGMVERELERNLGLHQAHGAESRSSRYQRVHESLQQMPVKVKAKPGRFLGEIEVSWVDSEGDILSRLYDIEPKCQVTLHRESTCSHRRKDMLVSGTGAKGEFSREDTCTCPQLIVPQKFFEATFKNLDIDTEYFPMVSRVDPQSLFGFPPRAVQPMALNEVDDDKKTIVKTEQQRSSSPILEGVVSHPDWDDTDSEVDAYDDVQNDDPEAFGIINPFSQHNNGFSQASRLRSLSRPRHGAGSQSQNGFQAVEELPEVKSEQDAQNDQITTVTQELHHAQIEIRTLTDQLQITRDELVQASAALEARELELRSDLRQSALGTATLVKADPESTLQESRDAKQALDDAQAQIFQLVLNIETANASAAAKQQEIDDLKATAQQAGNEKQSAGDESSSEVRDKIRILQGIIRDLEENEQNLKSKLNDAENALDQQVQLFHDTAARRKGSSDSVKRGLEHAPGGSSDLPDRKRQRTKATIDLTDD